MMPRLLRDSRVSAAAVLLAMLAALWVRPCVPTTLATEGATRVAAAAQDSHACCETTGLRARPTCCRERVALGESALVTSQFDGGSAAPGVTGIAIRTLAEHVAPAPALAEAVSRPPRLSILRV